jgi:hypothetical protein
MTSDSGGEHPADSFQGPPDAHVTVKYLTPKSKSAGAQAEGKGSRVVDLLSKCFTHVYTPLGGGGGDAAACAPPWPPSPHRVGECSVMLRISPEAAVSSNRQ